MSTYEAEAVIRHKISNLSQLLSSVMFPRPGTTRAFRSRLLARRRRRSAMPKSLPGRRRLWRHQASPRDTRRNAVADPSSSSGTSFEAPCLCKQPGELSCVAEHSTSGRELGDCLRMRLAPKELTTFLLEAIANVLLPSVALLQDKLAKFLGTCIPCFGHLDT